MLLITTVSSPNFRIALVWAVMHMEYTTLSCEMVTEVPHWHRRELLTKCKQIVKALISKSSQLEETQLIVDGMEEIENEVDTDLLYPIENDVQERSTTLKQEVPTRWSSALRMAKSVLTNITFVTRILEISKKYELILSSRIYNVCKH